MEYLIETTNTYRVWNAFQVKDIGDYIFLYKVQDVSMSVVADIDFMKTVSAKFNLNPVDFVMLASFSWECALKITRIEMELLAMLTKNSKSYLSLW